MLSLIWRKLGDSLTEMRIVVLDTWFTSLLCNEYPRFKKWKKTTPYQWNSVCKNYLCGKVPSRSGNLMWFDQVDIIYAPMNWGKGHWVSLVIHLKEGKIQILDSFIAGNATKQMKKFMTPFVEMLPCLIKDQFSAHPTQYPIPESFTFERVVDVSQNDRTGDCGPFAAKFIELHAQGLGLDGISEEMVDMFRMKYVIDVYEEFIDII